MEHIGSFEAKTHLSALLARVEAGESFVITKHGREVAKLGPVIESDAEQNGRAEFVRLSREIAGRVKMSREEVVDLIREGREH